MDLDGLAEELHARLQQERDGSVLAVWYDGSITVEPFSFREGRRLPDGSWEPSLISIPAKASLTVHDIRTRLEHALARARRSA